MAKATTTPLRRTLSTIFKFGVYGVLLGFVALAVAVGVAMSSLPSYAELVKRDDLGQMIRVRAANGAVIINTGSKQGITTPPGNPARSTRRASRSPRSPGTCTAARRVRDRRGAAEARPRRRHLRHRPRRPGSLGVVCATPR